MASPGINNFLSILNAHNGPAKSERFYVFLTPPTLLTGAISTANDLQYQCEATELPGRMLDAGEYRRYGYTKKLATGRSYQEQVLTFVGTNDYYARTFFENWQELVQPYANGFDLNYRQDYVGIITVVATDPTGADAYSVTLINAWPYSVHAHPLNWQDDSYVRVTVAFHYDRWMTTQQFQQLGLS